MVLSAWIQWRNFPPPWPILAMIFAGTVAVPAAFLVGLLWERLAYASVGELIRRAGRLRCHRRRRGVR